MGKELDKSEILDRNDALRRLNAGSDEMMDNIRISAYGSLGLTNDAISISFVDGSDFASHITIDPLMLRKKLVAGSEAHILKGAVMVSRIMNNNSKEL